MPKRVPKGLTRGKKPGGMVIGLAVGEQEAFDVLLLPNIRTYNDGARRLGISHDAFKQRMARGKFRIKMAKSLANWGEKYQKKRDEHLKGKYNATEPSVESAADSEPVV